MKLGHKKILETVRIKAEFEAIDVRAWDDLVEPVLKLLGIVDMDNDKKMELLNLEQLKDDVRDAPNSEVLIDKEKQRTLGKEITDSADAKNTVPFWAKV